MLLTVRAIALPRSRGTFTGPYGSLVLHPLQNLHTLRAAQSESSCDCHQQVDGHAREIQHRLSQRALVRATLHKVLDNVLSSERLQVLSS